MEKFESEGRLIHSVNRVPRLKRYTTDGEGVPIQDLWLDINRLDAHSDERVGYETQKPVALVERIIAASSAPNDTVLDPFAGSGTTMVAAERMGRQWIGVDSSLLACSIALGRARQEVPSGAIDLHGFPEDQMAAKKLLRDDPTAFGMWGTSMLGTLADRKAYNGSLATGIGVLKIARKRVQILSWVPLSSRPVGTVPTVKLDNRQVHHGFILRIGRTPTHLRRWLEQRMQASFHEVDLSHLANTDSVRQGLALEVLATATKS